MVRRLYFGSVRRAPCIRVSCRLGLEYRIELDLADVAVFGRLAEDPDSRGIDKLLPYGIPALAIVGGLFGLGRFLTAQRRHFSFLRLGQAVVGEILEVAVVSSDVAHRRSSEAPSAGLLDKGTEDMAQYGVDYRYEWEGARYEGHDDIDTRCGNGELCRLPRPAPGAGAGKLSPRESRHRGLC